MARNIQFYVTGISMLAMAVVAGRASAGQPNYPPEPTVIEYTVDPDWPKRPAELGPPASVPGVSVDQQGRVWCLNRGLFPVQIYSPQGELLKTWGQGQIKSAHAARFDSQGNVWIADFVGPRGQEVHGRRRTA